MLLDQDDNEEQSGHDNGQSFLIEKLFNLTELEKSKIIKLWQWRNGRWMMIHLSTTF